MKEPFFHKLVGVLESEMGDAYPELRKNRAHVERVLAAEEARFAETLDQGMRLLGDAMSELHGSTIPGRIAFKLHDTYGFPVDLTQDVAREANLTVDLKGFNRELETQRARARAASRFDIDLTKGIKTDAVTTFSGYDRLVGQGTVLEIFKNGEPAGSLDVGDDGIVVLDETPFYAESGGQVGDVGAVIAPGTVFNVKDTQKAGKAHLLLGTIEEGGLKTGDVVSSQVDAAARQATVLNHSATHLLHAALRDVLGEHVKQKGSLVAPDRLRFDFSHIQPVSREELLEIEQLVNDQIRANVAARDDVMDYDAAIESGALAFFGDKYDDRVRVMRFGEFSVELCGGTHVRRVGDIGLFKILSESGIAAGVRRIEAVTGSGALSWVRDAESRLDRVALLVKGTADDAEEKVAQLVERNKLLERELGAIKGQMASAKGDELIDQCVDVGGVQVIAARLDGADVRTLRETVDKLKDKIGSGVVVLSAVEDGKVRLVAGVTKDQTKRVKAGELVNAVAIQVGGKGGGRPDMAQAGGTRPELLDDALATVPDWVREQLAA